MNTPAVTIDTPGDSVLCRIRGEDVMLPKAVLTRKAGTRETETEIERWVEYYYPGIGLVHRSVHLHLKTGIFADAVAANFG